MCIVKNCKRNYLHSCIKINFQFIFNFLIWSSISQLRMTSLSNSKSLCQSNIKFFSFFIISLLFFLPNLILWLIKMAPITFKKSEIFLKTYNPFQPSFWIFQCLKNFPQYVKNTIWLMVDKNVPLTEIWSLE